MVNGYTLKYFRLLTVLPVLFGVAIVSMPRLSCAQATDPSNQSDIESATLNSHQDLWPMHGAFWHEASSAWPEKTIPRQITMAIKGKTPGSVNLIAIHPWYDPWKQERSEAWIREWCREKLEEGYDGIAIDHEGWTLKDPNFIQWVHEECTKKEKVLVVVPKISLEHSVRAWKWPYDRVVEWYARYSHAMAPWIYGYRGEDYLEQIQRLREHGYPHQIIPMGDGGFRPGYGGITEQDAIQTIEFLSEKGIGFALFCPHHAGNNVIEAMKNAYR